MRSPVGVDSVFAFSSLASKPLSRANLLIGAFTVASDWVYNTVLYSTVEVFTAPLRSRELMSRAGLSHQFVP